MTKLLIGLLFASMSVSAAELTASNGVELLVINGKEVERYAGGSEEGVSLPKGNYQLVIRYENEVDRGSQEVIFTSQPYVLDLEISDENLDISVPSIRAHSHATSFFREPIWTLTTQNGKTTELSAKPLTGSGFGAFNDLEKAVANYNREQGVIFDSGNAVNLQQVVVATNESGNVELSGDALTQLKLWYTKATTEEKKAFKRWMIDQDLN